MNKKPLYRKVSKTTHNGFPHADFDARRRSSYARNTKNGIGRSMHTAKGNGERLHDYTPLFKFLLKQEGRQWSLVWQECVVRLDTTEPVLYMVLNIRENGLVRKNWNLENGSVCSVDWKGRPFTDGTPKSFGYGEGSRFSTMFVDKDGKLQFVDKNYASGPDYEVERRWGETFNGNLYNTYMRPAKKVEKMKSYIKRKLSKN